MNREPPKDLAASVRQRLLNMARERREDFQRLLRRYAQERLLYRLSRSEHRDTFTLKGALLFAIWSSEPHRPTKDLDLLGRGDAAVATLVETFRGVCNEPVEPNGLVFLPEATFRRRGTLLPAHMPVALTETFGSAEAKQTQWQAFTRRSLPTADVPSLPDLIISLCSFIVPVLEALREGKTFTGTWTPGGPWTAAPPETVR